MERKQDLQRSKGKCRFLQRFGVQYVGSSVISLYADFCGSSYCWMECASFGRAENVDKIIRPAYKPLAHREYVAYGRQLIYEMSPIAEMK